MYVHCHTLDLGKQTLACYWTQLDNMDSTTEDKKLPPQLVSVMTGGGWLPLSTDGPGRYRTRCHSSAEDSSAQNCSGIAELGPTNYATATENTGILTGNSYMDTNLETPMDQERGQQQPSRDSDADTAATRTNHSMESSRTNPNHTLLPNTQDHNVKNDAKKAPNLTYLTRNQYL